MPTQIAPPRNPMRMKWKGTMMDDEDEDDDDDDDPEDNEEDGVTRHKFNPDN
jgi:hypothetical protein